MCGIHPLNLHRVLPRLRSDSCTFFSGRREFQGIPKLSGLDLRGSQVDSIYSAYLNGQEDVESEVWESRPELATLMLGGGLSVLCHVSSPFALSTEHYNMLELRNNGSVRISRS